MTKSPLDDILDRLHALQAEIEEEMDRLLDEKRQQFKYTLEQGKVRFEQSVKVWQQKQRTGVWTYLSRARPRHIVTTVLIYSLFILFAAMDIAVMIYQQICFRIYEIPLVRRRDYIVIDRPTWPI